MRALVVLLAACGPAAPGPVDAWVSAARGAPCAGRPSIEFPVNGDVRGEHFDLVCNGTDAMLLYATAVPSGSPVVAYPVDIKDFEEAWNAALANVHAETCLTRAQVAAGLKVQGSLFAHVVSPQGDVVCSAARWTSVAQVLERIASGARLRYPTYAENCCTGGPPCAMSVACR